jgi:hypothetical protein
MLVCVGLASGDYFFVITGNTNGSLGGAFDFRGSTLPVPEPTTVAMFLAGLGMLGFMGRRRHRG